MCSLRASFFQGMEPKLIKEENGDKDAAPGYVEAPRTRAKGNIFIHIWEIVAVVRAIGGGSRGRRERWHGHILALTKLERDGTQVRPCPINSLTPAEALLH
jgi:hypothetical protein